MSTVGVAAEQQSGRGGALPLTVLVGVVVVFPIVPVVRRGGGQRCTTSPVVMVHVRDRYVHGHEEHDAQEAVHADPVEEGH